MSLSYKADYMNSRKMMLRQNIPALNIYSKSMELDDNLLDHMMERERSKILVGMDSLYWKIQLSFY